MYQTLDGEWTCEACTMRQCDGEIPNGTLWFPVDAECYICAREGREAARQALADFAKAAAALNGLWQLHCDGSAIDRALCDAYPEGWESFDTVEEQIRRWVGKVHCPHCHDDPAGCAECPHCPDCGDRMRDHEEGRCPV